MESEKNKEMLECPFCHELIKKGNGWHTNRCREKYLKEITDEQINQFKMDYIEEGLSLPQISQKYNLPYAQLQKIFPKIGIRLRTVKEANNMPGRRKLYEQTMLKNHGTTHNFNKDSELRKRWEQRLFEEEGITNVFQRKEVIDKIKQTMLDKYGEEGIYYNRTKGSMLSYWIEKLGEEEGIKKYNEICHEKGKSNRIEYYIDLYGEEEGIKKYTQRLNDSSKWVNRNGLNDKCAKILEKNGIPYEQEFKIHRTSNNRFYSYDFKIGNLLIELNGVYWHCSPKKYQPNDIVHFPNNIFIKAKDKWAYDKEKGDYAVNNGFQFETIWEDEFNENKLLEVINKYYNYGNSKNKENN